MLKEFGFEKINFVGGEPMLIKDIANLIKITKQLGFYTSIVTNGSLITENFLSQNHKYIDMIGLSIDSINSKTNKKIGRALKSKPMTGADYKKIIDAINNHDIALKINTVVSSLNKNEDVFNIINYAKPLRWKVFQVLKVTGENDKTFKSFEISDSSFSDFCRTQAKSLIFPKVLVKEENEIMKGSYLMVNPEGCFFDNVNGNYTVSEKIINAGIAKTLKQIQFDYSKFQKRDGHYYKQYNRLAS